MADPVVLALLDGRAGNTAQTLGVAEALGLPYRELAVGFSPWARCASLLPLPAASRLCLDDATRHALLSLPAAPDVVVATGRRLAYAAYALKSRFAPDAVWAQIMNPHVRDRRMDVLALPAHDRPPRLHPKTELVRTLGAPNAVSRRMPSPQEAEAIRRRIVGPEETLCGVCVGGSVKGRPVSEEDIRRFLADLRALKKETGLRFLVTDSRRTPPDLRSAVREAFPDAIRLDAAGLSVLDLYAVSDLLCVTGDSVSMCSEACSTGKPVYIALLPSVMREKHRRLARALTDGGHARLLGERPSAASGLWIPSAILADADAVAAKVSRRFIP
jgi:mitochondrial fission protein ELM1